MTQISSLDLEQTYTLDEFMSLDLPKEADGSKYELWEGRIVVSPQPGSSHGSIGNLLAYYLTDFVLKYKVGKVWSNGTFKILDVKNGLAPDVAFIAHPNVPPETSKAVPRQPDLAIEIRFPDDSVLEMTEKVRKYQKGGVQLIWLVDPERKIAAVYHQADQEPTTIQPDGELDGESLLPGFKLKLADLFQNL